MPAWFENLLPETGSALRTKLCSVFALKETDSFGLLQALGGDLPGAVTVHDVPMASDGGAALPADTSARDAPRDEDRGLRFSLAGMQLKFSMAHLNHRFVVPASGEDGRWIVKFPGDQFPELPEVEASTMAWASAAGFDVPTHKLIDTNQIEGLPKEWFEHCPTAYAIERFDRADDGARIHHEDLCQALDLLPSEKYGDSPGHTIGFDGVVKLVSDACGESEATQICLRIGFDIASGNGDNHLKNWSLLWGDEALPILSPCYDLVSTISWEKFGWTGRRLPKLGLGIGQVHQFARIDSDALERHQRKSGFRHAKEAIMEGARRAFESWPSVTESAPARMREALKEHWRRVPILKSMGALAT